MTTTPHELDGEYQYLQLSRPTSNSHIVIVALNRPEKRNAICTAMWKEVGDVFSRIGGLGDGCRCIIVTGVGKAFCSGIDVSDAAFFPATTSDSDEQNIKEDPARRGMSFLPKILEMQRCFSVIEECLVPVIAAINGSCIGAGIDLACCCDVRLAGTNAKFSVREVKIGLAADIGTLQRLPKITGNDSRVRELCFTGEMFGCEEALRIGFISRVVTNNGQDLMKDALHLAGEIASNSPVAVSGTKKSLVYSRDHTVADGLRHIANHNALALMTDDMPVAAMAALSKQTASFPDLHLHSRL